MRFKIQSPKSSGAVWFTSEESMREQAAQVARFEESNVTLYREVVGGTKFDPQFEEIDTVIWDGLPGVNETVEVDITFAATVTLRVRRYDHYGATRDLPEAIRACVLDALEHELQFQEPEDHDLVQYATEATIQNFDITAMRALTSTTSE